MSEVKRLAFNRFYQALQRQSELFRMGIVDRALDEEVKILKEIYDSMSVLRR